MLASLQLLGKLLRDRSANAVVLTAFSTLAMVGGAGLATDTIQWTLWKRQLQRMADSAALAGAYTNARGGSANSAANGEINRYNFITLTGSPTIETPPSAGPYNGNSKAVRVVVNSTKALPFSSLFMNNATNVSAQATAAAVGFGEYCVVSLESTTNTGITFQGSATVNLGCGVATNSQSSTQAVYAGGSSNINASPVAAVGNVPASTNYATGTTLLSYTIPQPDPYSGLPDPTSLISSCNSSISVGSNKSKNIQNNNNGVQCYKDISVQGTLTLDPGVYVIDGNGGGGLNIGAQGSVTGTGVTFILTSSGSADTIATMNMNGNSHLSISAPDSGTYSGVLVYQDRRAILGSKNYLTGDSTSFFQGAIYMPGQEVQMTGNSTMNTNCLQIVARQVTFTGSNYITNSCPSSSASRAITGVQIRLVN